MDDLTFTEEEIKKLFHPPSAQPAERPRPDTPLANPTTPPSPFHHTLPPAPYQRETRTTPAPVASPAYTRYHSKSSRLARSLLLFFASFFATFTLLNGGAFGSRLTFWWNADVVGEEQTAPSTPSTSPGFSTSPVPLSPTPIPAPTTVTQGTNRLNIPKINVDAPIVWNADPANILADLQKGVAHYRGTALPNDQSGNVFVTGHSSNYVWDRGAYNRVFANLDKLVAGDILSITTEKAVFTYRVSDAIVVKPTETSVLAQTPRPIVSLMTCTPVGTNLRRLVVRADLIEIRAI